MVLNFISKDVREYIQKNSLVFSDFEKAALISHRLHQSEGVAGASGKGGD